jgi:hypothetical protein
VSKSAPIKLPDDGEPRAFIIQHVWTDCMVPARYCGTFASLAKAYAFIERMVESAGGRVRQLLANAHLGVACVYCHVNGQECTYLITPDDADYTPSSFKRAKAPFPRSIQ